MIPEAMIRQVQLDGNQLDLQQFAQIVEGNFSCSLSEEALKRVQASRMLVESEVAQQKVVYGITTGFGKLSDVRIGTDDVEKLQLNLLRSHAVGVGDPFPTPVVRAMLLLRANALAKGYSGIRTETLKLLIDCLNHGVHPIVKSQGSLGASGDLAPLSHMALVLVGEGKAEYEGVIYSGAQALAKAGLRPVKLEAKEGLALINGTQAMTAVGALAVIEAKRLGLGADIAASLTMEALHGIIDAFDKDLLVTRPHVEQEEVASRIRSWLSGSKRITRQGELRVQDAYSIRCIPQVHGASWQAVDYVKNKVNVEMNSTTDNPIVLEDGRILSGGQFHGQPIAISMDLLKIAAAEWANISERRVERLVNPQLSGLPPFLAVHPGIESGLMIAQYVAAALVSENKVLAHPASVDSIPSSANQEDHVSMGTIGARQARQILRNSARVIAIEMICASQAIFLDEAENELSEHSKKHLEWIRKIVPPFTQDTSASEFIDLLADTILSTDIE